MLKLNISRTRLESNYYSSCTGRSSEIYVAAAVQALGEKETQDETQFTTKIGGKTSLAGSQLFRFAKDSFPVTCLMPYYAETAQSRLTLLYG
jgi:hypothetical protein